jgi:hypothetical protein
MAFILKSHVRLLPEVIGSYLVKDGDMQSSQYMSVGNKLLLPLTNCRNLGDHPPFKKRR